MINNLPEILFAILLFASIFPLVPLRWSIFAYLLIAHITLSDIGFESAASLGTENAIKIIILPTILLLRIMIVDRQSWKKNLLNLKNSIALQLWLALWLYTAVTMVWSPFQLSALKQMGYFYAYTISLPIFLWLYSSNEQVANKIVSLSVISSIMLAIVRSVLMNGSISTEERFTTFTSYQSFGLYLGLIFAVLVTARYKSISGNLYKFILMLAVVQATIINGTRTGVLITVMLAVISLVLSFFYSKNKQPYVIVILFTLPLIITSSFIVFQSKFEFNLFNSRLTELQELLVGKTSLQDIGTAQFRMTMYQTVLNTLGEQNWQEWLWGNGTSSAAFMITSGRVRYRGYDEYTVDANRTVHNEYLRALYEWGIFGSTLFISLILMILFRSARSAFKYRTFESIINFFSILSICIYMGVENVLATSGSPLGLAIVILLVNQTLQSSQTTASITRYSTTYNTNSQLRFLRQSVTT